MKRAFEAAHGQVLHDPGEPRVKLVLVAPSRRRVYLTVSALQLRNLLRKADEMRVSKNLR